jgi:hypothetical protein
MDLQFNAGRGPGSAVVGGEPGGPGPLTALTDLVGELLGEPAPEHQPDAGPSGQIEIEAGA